MKQKYLGLVLVASGLILILGLLVWAAQQKSVDKSYISSPFYPPQKLNPPDYMVLPLEYGKGLNSGLWGFERILREKNVITGGNYQQICQSQGSILKQLGFWLNAPYTFATQHPDKEVFVIRPSILSQEGFSHHFALDKIMPFPNGIKLVREEVKIEMTKENEQYQLIINTKEGHFSAYKPVNPNTWLEQKRAELKQKPLLSHVSDNERKIIAFRLGDCS